MSFQSIAIDGPSGAGKSTLAKMIAERLGFLYVDTGAIYRTVGLWISKNGADPHNAPAVIGLLDTIQIELNYGADGLQHMYLNGEDVTQDIRQAFNFCICLRGFRYSAGTRLFIGYAARLARTQNVVMDGRDIGTVVLPDADVKVFLTADPEDRARRRYEELLTRGQQAEYDTVLKDLEERDRNDSTRASAPLRQAEDAILVDTTGNTLEQSFELLLKTVKEHLDV